MYQEIDRPSAETVRIIERGETYCHEEHGTVEVVGIWHGARPIGSVSTTIYEEPVAIRYVPKDDSGRIGERSDYLAGFLTAIA